MRAEAQTTASPPGKGAAAGRGAVHSSSTTCTFVPENPNELSRPHAVELDSAASLGRWREQLTLDEIQTLRERTSDVWPRFYSDEDWG